MRLLPVLFLFAAGCTDRFIQVRSDPPGATVYLDGKEAGRTPCDVQFTWYGDREVVLEKEGFRSRTEILRVRAPWWQWPGMDFLTDVVLPIQFTDRRVFFFLLQPHKADPSQAEEIRGNAEELRKKAKEKP